MDAVYRLSFAILGDESDARDAAQDTFVTAWRQIGRLRDADRFDAWLQRVAVNSARMTHRARRRRGVREIPSSRMAAVDGSPGERRAPPIPMRRRLTRPCGSLPVEQRSILVLHHLEGQPITALAEILDIPVGTVKSRLHTARQALQAADRRRGDATDDRRIDSARSPGTTIASTSAFAARAVPSPRSPTDLTTTTLHAIRHQSVGSALGWRQLLAPSLRSRSSSSSSCGGLALIGAQRLAAIERTSRSSPIAADHRWAGREADCPSDLSVRRLRDPRRRRRRPRDRGPRLVLARRARPLPIDRRRPHGPARLPGRIHRPDGRSPSCWARRTETATAGDGPDGTRLPDRS